MSDETLEVELDKALAKRRLDLYTPYPKQLAFHQTGALGGAPGGTTYVERLLLAGNQLGKTMSASAETAMHLTGQYPSWWNGRRFKDPVTCWVGSPTSQTTRDSPQRLLMGPPGEWGTGMIPNAALNHINKAIHGVPDAVESVLVTHKPTGRTSRILFKSYDQGRLRWQGETLDFVWFDEEPPLDIYSEGKTRTQVKNGFVILTFTPLLGMSEVVLRFLKEKPPGSITIMMGIVDALHYSEEKRKQIIASYPEHERSARAEGIPVMGSGAVFPVPEESIKCSPFQIPDFYYRICGLDIGWDHPTAAAWLAWDKDTDVVYIYDTYRMREQTPIVHSAAIKSRGPWIVCVWPPDGLIHDKGSGRVIATQYKELGVNMFPLHATHPPQPGKREGTGGNSTEAGIIEMLQRMQTGRFKVFSTCVDFFEEFRMYYRKEGLIVKKTDDLMSATRQAIMMLRHAKVRIDPRKRPVMNPYQPSDPGTGVLG